MKRIYSLLFLVIILSQYVLWDQASIFAQTESPTPTPETTITLNPTPTPEDNQQEIADKQKKVEELQNKLKEVQGQKISLDTTLQYINTKISLSQAEINKSQSELSSLENQLEDLGTRINGLDQSLDVLSDILVNRVHQSYKQKQTNPLHLLVLSKGITDFFTRYHYLQIAQDHTREIMQLAEEQKANFDTQKIEKEQKQLEVEKKRGQLQSQQNVLASERNQQQQLYNATKNDEAKYQKLLADAQAELDSLRSFTSGKGGGLLSAQNSPDGWYYSQRDERWGNQCIGETCGKKNPDTVWEVGCLITSIAMVKKKYGENISPADIARNSSYFVPPTASMYYPKDGGWPAPNGYVYSYPLAPNMNTIDHELTEGRPVIIKLRVNSNSVGTHFLVLKSGANGDYIMHDPWEGYDKKFTDYYSFGQIIQFGILKKV